MALHLVADGGKHYWIEPEAAELQSGNLPAACSHANPRSVGELQAWFRTDVDCLD